MSLDGFGFDTAPWEVKFDSSVLRRTSHDVLVRRECQAVDLFGVGIEGEVALGVIDVP